MRSASRLEPERVLCWMPMPLGKNVSDFKFGLVHSLIHAQGQPCIHRIRNLFLEAPKSPP